jgi:hypothetical protein
MYPCTQKVSKWLDKRVAQHVTGRVAGRVALLRPGQVPKERERREHISCANLGIHGSGMEFLLSRASTLARDFQTKQTETGGSRFQLKIENVFKWVILRVQFANHPLYLYGTSM